MSKLTKEEKLRRYHAIYDQIHLNPRIRVHEISKNLRLARNTVSGYLDYMYESEILFGPQLRLKFYPGLNQFMYLAKFDDPYVAFDKLQRDPKVTYCSMFLGDWNVMFMSDANHDPSRVPGFEHLLHKGRQFGNMTPWVPLRDWETAFLKIKKKVVEFDPIGVHEPGLESNGPPPWDDEEWKLFYAYQSNFRKKVTPVLRKYLISSDKFYRWMETLPQHTSISLRFYPDGYENYTHFIFFFKTLYPRAVVSLFSNFPTSPVCTQIEGGVITGLSIKSDLTFSDLSVTVHRMKSCGMIKNFNQAIAMLHYTDSEEGYAKLR
jgi:hypothetical protein